MSPNRLECPLSNYFKRARQVLNVSLATTATTVSSIITIHRTPPFALPMGGSACVLRVIFVLDKFGLYSEGRMSDTGWYRCLACLTACGYLCATSPNNAF